MKFKKSFSLILIVSIIVLGLMLSACTDSLENINPIKLQKDDIQFGEQFEKKPIRMIKADGDLYYDTGLISTITARCGTLDKELKCTAKIGEIPQNDGEANFLQKSDSFGYQNFSEITKEVLIDGNWVIFKKFDNYIGNPKNLKYCFYIKGHLNNAAVDSEIVVLSEKEDITFSKVYEPMLSSQLDAGKDIGGVVHTTFNSFDEWGITLRADDVSDDELTLEIEQFGGNADGDLQTGPWYSIEVSNDGEWIPVATNPLIDYAWEDVAYIIKNNDITEFEIDWEWLYGELPSGYYRINKEIMNFRKTGDFDKKIYSAYFTID